MQVFGTQETAVSDIPGNVKSDQPDLITDPAWFPEGFDARRKEILFVETDRRQLAEQAFLDGRWHRNDARRLRRAAETMFSHVPPEKSPLRLIWHTGFCCSTLLAKALDRPGVNLSLCEPQILVDIAEGHRTQAVPEQETANAAKLAFFFLSRPFVAGERVAVKPSPAANVLLRHAANWTSGPVLFLFSDCRTFLISICKMGEEGRKYVRRVFLALLADGHFPVRWPVPKLLSMSDLELAALVWHMQIAEFQQALAAYPPAGTASLDCDALLAEPEQCLSRLDRFFSLGLGTELVEAIVAGPLFRRNAKTGEPSFDPDRRRREHDHIARELGHDLTHIIAQSYDICRTSPRTSPLSNILVPIDKNYCP
jgi:hypothetical protein